MKQKDELSVAVDAIEKAGSSMSATDIVSATFDEYVKNFGTYIVLALVGFIPTILFTVLPFFFGADDDELNFDEFTGGEIAGFIGFGLGVGLISWILGIVVSNGIMHVALKSQKENEQVAFGDAFSFGLSLLWKILGISIVVGLITIAGFIMLIIPGIIFAIWYMFSVVHAVDTGEGLNDAMAASKALGKGNYGTIIAVGILYFLISIGLSFLGFIPVLGQFVSLFTIPLVPIGISIMYLAFRGDIGGGAPAVQPAADAAETKAKKADTKKKK